MSRSYVSLNNYTLKRWQALTRYRDDGAIEIDNNAAERALRAPVLSRKNFSFAGADSGGERAAALYTLLQSAKLNGLNPEAYLYFVLERIADHPNNRLADLFPGASRRSSLKVSGSPRNSAPTPETSGASRCLRRTLTQ